MKTHHNISGIHHITAIASSASENMAFYEEVLELRLVKKTVNFAGIIRGIESRLPKLRSSELNYEFVKPDGQENADKTTVALHGTGGQ